MYVYIQWHMYVYIQWHMYVYIQWPVVYYWKNIRICMYRMTSNLSLNNIHIYVYILCHEWVTNQSRTSYEYNIHIYVYIQWPVVCYWRNIHIRMYTITSRLLFKNIYMYVYIQSPVVYYWKNIHICVFTITSSLLLKKYTCMYIYNTHSIYTVLLCNRKWIVTRFLFLRMSHKHSLCVTWRLHDICVTWLDS